MNAGDAMIDIAERDADVPLSAQGRKQSEALGRWFAARPANERPTMLFVSPYRRAMETARAIREARGLAADASETVDERVREKEFGVLDRLTREGIALKFPDQAELRARLGKFYYRPPGGESWTDVILRLRSLCDTLSLHYAAPGSRVLIVAHQVIVLCLRYLIDELDEKQILAIDAEGDIANCGVTEYVLDGARLVLERYNFSAPIEEEGAPVTKEPDVQKAPR
jgi:probable phosphoglycerate mutase